MNGRTSGDYMSGRISPERFERDEKGGYKLDAKGKMVTTNVSNEPTWAAMEKVRQAWKDSGFDRRLHQATRHADDLGVLWKGREYWHEPTEKMARTFERYIQHKLKAAGRENTYLSGFVNTVDPGADEGHKAYKSLWPTDEEVAAMAPAYDALMAAYRQKKYGSAEPQQFSAESLQAFRFRTLDQLLTQAS